MEFLLAPGGCLRGEARVPGDKSMSHRALMLGALAEGETRVSGFLHGEDALATLAALRAMGVEIRGPERGELAIRGVGMRGLQPSQAVLDMGNSGTSMRLLAGILAGQDFSSELRGDASLMRRPMQRVITPLSRMGAVLESAPGAARRCASPGARRCAPFATHCRWPARRSSPACCWRGCSPRARPP